MAPPTTRLSDTSDSPGLLRWIGSTAQVRILAASPLPDQGAILVVRRCQIRLLHAAYRNCFPERHRRAVDQAAALEEPLPEPGLRGAIELARAVGAPLVPVGLSASPMVTTPGRRGAHIPLPRSHIVAVFEAPFQLPDRPEQIPDTWLHAILHLLDTANGRARDELATWKRRGFSDT